MDASALFVEVYGSYSHQPKNYEVTLMEQDHCNTSAVCELAHLIFGARAIGTGKAKVVTQYKDQVRLYEEVIQQKVESMAPQISIVSQNIASPCKPLDVGIFPESCGFDAIDFAS